jgi:hypothetical protein
MNSKLIVIKWKNSLGHIHEIQRLITSEINESWVDGYMSGMHEIINRHGGRVISTAIEDA